MGFLFFKRKKKKKDEVVVEENAEQQSSNENAEPHVEEQPEEEIELTPKQKEKQDKLKNLESKISKILQSNNIEIVDENEDDDFEQDEEAAKSDKQKQQDYESLKGLYGKDSKKNQEVTLTIDDFDYTYIGKYVEDYDLVHMKNIKKIKLQNKYKKLIKKIVIASVALIILIVGGITAYNIMKVKPVYVMSVTLSQESQEYFVNDTFDYTGLYLLIKKSDGTVDKTPLGRLNFQDYRGNYSREENMFTAIGNVELYFQYNGFMNIKLDVKVVRKQEIGIKALYTKGLFNLKKNDCLDERYLITMLEYSNYNPQKISSLNPELSVTIDGNKLVYSEDRGGYLITEDVSEDSVIVVEYGNYSLELDSTRYSVTTVTVE